MSVWTLLQIGFNLATFVALLAFGLRLRRPPQDDPRLSRGLQLLQTKITVLEDLSDRTDHQVKQLTALLDQKTRTLQNKVIEAEEQVLKIENSMAKSLEVAEIFQDKIPHQEIVERRQKVEYVRAARLAHAGLKIDDIAAQVALPREQIELIAKFNRDQLLFDEDKLPEWANRNASAPPTGSKQFGLADMDFLGNLEPQNNDSMAKLEQDFKASVEEAKRQEALANQTLRDSKVAEHLRATVQSSMQSVQPAVMSMRATAQTLRDKLVATAEELVRAQHDHLSIENTTAHGADFTPVVPGRAAEEPSLGEPLRARELRQALNSEPSVKKVVFPRIDRPT